MWRLLFVVVVACTVSQLVAYTLTGNENLPFVTVNNKLQVDVPMLVEGLGPGAGATSMAITSANDSIWVVENTVLSDALGVHVIADDVSLSIVPATDAVFTITSAEKTDADGVVVKAALTAGGISGAFRVQYGTKCVFAGVSDTTTNFTITISNILAGTYYDYVQYDHTAGGATNYFYMSFDCPFEYMKVRSSADISGATLASFQIYAA